MALEHLNLHPVSPKNVPIFWRKGKYGINRQSGDSGSRRYQQGRKHVQVMHVEMLCRCQVRDGWILKEGVFLRGSAELSASLSRLLLVLFLAKQEKDISALPNYK